MERNKEENMLRELFERVKLYEIKAKMKQLEINIFNANILPQERTTSTREKNLSIDLLCLYQQKWKQIP